MIPPSFSPYPEEDTLFYFDGPPTTSFPSVPSRESQCSNSRRHFYLPFLLRHPQVFFRDRSSFAEDFQTPATERPTLFMVFFRSSPPQDLFFENLSFFPPLLS